MKVDWKFFLVAASAAAPAILADKDNSYYPGFTNPNVKRKMYWKDSFNVLQDLDEFDALYIKYHGCVWSPYGNGDNACGVAEYGYGENDQDDDGDDESDDEGEYNWYQGQANCYRANVAYTLYGQLKGGSFGGCNKKTFINSFFTTYGVDTFAEAFGIGTYYANSYCYASDDAGRRGRKLEDGGSSDGGSNDGDLSNNEMFYQDVTSTGTGCSSDGTFVLDYFQGAYCDGSHYQATTDTLDDFNDLVEDLNCVQIYTTDDGYEEDDEDAYEEEADGYDEDDGDYRDRALEDNGADYEDNEGYEVYEDNEESSNSEEYGENDDEESLVYQVLGYSRACSILEYPDDCPDPYGLVNKYTNNLQRAASWHSEKARNMTSFIFSSVLFISGLCMILYVRFVKKLSKKYRKKRANNHVPEPSSIDEDSHFDDTSPQLSNFTRSVGSQVSSSVQSVKQSIQEYAEEVVTSSSSDGSKEAMLPIAKPKNSSKKEPSNQSKKTNAIVTDNAAPSNAVDKTNVEVYDNTDTADAMLTERGKPTAAEDKHKTSGSNAKKRHKRPAMARLSKKLFGSSKAKPSA